MPEEYPASENGLAGQVAGRERPLPHTDKVAKELSVPNFNRFGKYLGGY